MGRITSRTKDHDVRYRVGRRTCSCLRVNLVNERPPGTDTHRSQLPVRPPPLSPTIYIHTRIPRATSLLLAPIILFLLTIWPHPIPHPSSHRLLHSPITHHPFPSSHRQRRITTRPVSTLPALLSTLEHEPPTVPPTHSTHTQSSLRLPLLASPRATAPLSYNIAHYPHHFSSNSLAFSSSQLYPTQRAALASYNDPLDSSSFFLRTHGIRNSVRIRRDDIYKRPDSPTPYSPPALGLTRQTPLGVSPFQSVQGRRLFPSGPYGFPFQVAYLAKSSRRLLLPAKHPLVLCLLASIIGLSLVSTTLITQSTQTTT